MISGAVGLCRYTNVAYDLVITGDNGTGKIHILKAFAMRACEQGIRMRYARCVDLLDDLHAGLADGTYARRLKGWARPAPPPPDPR
jgi:DNA replication protein DnaC